MSTDIEHVMILATMGCYYRQMTFHAKNTLLLLLVIALVAILVGTGASFMINAESRQPESTLPHAEDMLTESLHLRVSGVVTATYTPSASFLIEEDNGLEKNVTVSSDTKILETIIERDDNGVEVNRVEQEVNIDDLEVGTYVDIYTSSDSVTASLDEVRYTTEIQSDSTEYIKESQASDTYLRGTFVSFDEDTNTLVLAALSSQDESTFSLTVPEVAVYMLTNAQKPTILHSQTPISLDVVEEGSVVHVRVTEDSITEEVIIQGLLIAPLL